MSILIPGAKKWRGLSIHQSTPQTIPSAGTTKLTLNTPVIDTDNVIDLVNDRFYIPAGVTRIKISAMLMFDSQTSGNYRYFYLYRNNAKLNDLYAPQPQAQKSIDTYLAAHPQIVMTPIVIAVVAGHYFDFRFQQDAAVSINTESLTATIEYLEA